MNFFKLHNSVFALSILCLLLCTPRIPALEKPKLDLSPEEWSKLKKGELTLRIEQVKDEKGRRGTKTNTFRLLNASPVSVWEVLYEPDKDYQWAPRIVRSRITKRGKNFLNIHYVFKTPIKTFQFHVHREYNSDKLIIESHLVENEKNDLSVSDGLYVLYPFEGGKKTVMSYSLYVVTNPNIPSIVTDYFAKQGCREWMENLKKRVESGGKWQKK